MKRLALILLTVITLMACHQQPAEFGSLESHFVQTDGTNIHYKVAGQGGQAIVFVHGLGCDLNTWEAQYDAFANSKDTKLIFIDLPGFGQSDKPETDYTLEFFANAVKAAMDDAKIEKAILVGHSLGTPICRQMCFDYPERVSALVDIDGVYVLLPADPEACDIYVYEMQAFASGFCQDNVAEYFAGFVGQLAGPNTPQFVTDYAMSTMPKTPGYVACSTMGYLIMRYLTGQKINVPAAIICTQNSGIEPDNKDRMAALYTNMDYTELTTCGHFIHMEQPEVVNQAIRKLLGK